MTLKNNYPGDLLGPTVGAHFLFLGFRVQGLGSLIIPFKLKRASLNFEISGDLQHEHAVQGPAGLPTAIKTP